MCMYVYVHILRIMGDLTNTMHSIQYKHAVLALTTTRIYFLNCLSYVFSLKNTGMLETKIKR